MAEITWDDAPKAGPTVQWDEAPAPEAGSTRAFRRYVAEPATALVGGALQADPRLQATQGALSWLTHGLISPPEPPSLGRTVSRVVAPFRGTDLPSDKPLPGEGVSQGAAELLVPQTPTQAATMAVTAGAGKLATGLPKALQAIFRVGGGLVGNEAGNVVEGKEAGTGALATGGVMAGIEVALPGIGKVLRMLPGAKGRQAAEDAAAYAQSIGRLSPPLAGAKTVQELRTLASGPGQDALGAAKGAANEEIAKGIGARAGTLEIPALGQTVPTATAMNPTPGVQPVTVMKPATKPMTLQEANDALSEIGVRAFGKNPLDRTFQGVDQRQLYGKVRSEIEAALDRADPTGYSSVQFDKAQEAYKRGLSLLNPLTSDRAVRSVGNKIQFNTPFFQQWASNSKNRAALVNKLGQDGYDTLIGSLTRGGGPDTRDVLAAGAGRFLDAARGTFGRGQNTGSAQYLGVPLRTALPSLGSEYAGRAPFGPGAGTITAADLTALRALGILPQGQP